MPPTDDRALVARILDGDRSAGDELCARLYPSVQRVAASILRDLPYKVAEVTEDAFLRLYQNDMRALRAFQGEDLGPYVRQIARNSAYQAVREERPGLRAPLGPEQSRDREDPARPESTELEDDRNPGPEDLLRAEQLRVIVREAIASGCLNDRERTAIERVYLDEADRRDVARELGVTPGNLDVILHRARRKLAACLARLEDEL